MPRRLVIAALLVTFANGTSAETASEQMPCRDDFHKLCPGVVPGGGRALDCLGSQKDKLSKPCRKVIDARRK